MKKLVLFDLDGTLCDTIDSLVYSVNESLKEMGLVPIADSDVRSFVGNGARVLMERSLLRAGEPDLSRIEEAMTVYGRIFDANCCRDVFVYPGIRELLKELKKMGIQTGVLSNKPHAQTVKVVETIFGEAMFTHIEGQQDDKPRKPDKRAILHVLEQLGIEKQDCLYVGDSEVDLLAGQNAGVDVVSVSWGFRDRDQLMQAGARCIVDHPSQIKEIMVVSGN